MEAIRDVGALLAARNKDRTELLTLDRLDQVLDDAGVIKWRRGQSRGTGDVVRAAGGECRLSKAAYVLRDIIVGELEREIGLRCGVVVVGNVGGPFDVNSRLGWVYGY